MIFFVLSLGCLISPSKSILNFSCVRQCPLEHSAWLHSYLTVESPCFVHLGPLSVLVLTTELRGVLLILSVWRGLQIPQLITTELPTVSRHGLPTWSHYLTQHLSREHLHNLMFIGPWIIVIVEEWKTNLMSLAIFFALLMCRTCFGH